MAFIHSVCVLCTAWFFIVTSIEFYYGIVDCIGGLFIMA